MDKSNELLTFLKQLGICYDLYRHAPVMTIADCYAIESLPFDDAEYPKNVFLSNRQKTDFYLMLLQHDRAFRTSVVSKRLGVSRLSFAPDSLLNGFLNLEAGAVSPLGLMFDRERRVRLVMDKALERFEYLYFHPCVNTASVRMRRADFTGIFLPAIGHDLTIISCDEEEP